MRFTLAQLEAFTHIGGRHVPRRRETSQCLAADDLATHTRAGIRARRRAFCPQRPHFQLTAEGHGLVDYARRMLGAAGELRDHYQRRNSLKGVVRLGVPNLFGILCLSDLLRRLEEWYPNLKASVRLHDSATLAQMLEDQDLDIAILVEPNVGPRIRYIRSGARNTSGWPLQASGCRACFVRRTWSTCT